MTGVWVRRKFEAHACGAGAWVAVLLATSLAAGPRHASWRGDAPCGEQVAQADREAERPPQLWLGLGEVLTKVLGKGRTPDRDLERPGVDRGAEHVVTPLDVKVGSPTVPDARR